VNLGQLVPLRVLLRHVFRREPLQNAEQALLQAMWPSCHPTISVKAPEGELWWTIKAGVYSRSDAVLVTQPVVRSLQGTQHIDLVLS